MKKIKTLGYLAIEKIGEEIVVHSLKLFKTAKEAKDFVLQQKNNKVIKDLLVMVEPIFTLKKMTRKLSFTKGFRDRQIIKSKIKKYFNRLEEFQKDFIEDFLQETHYYSIASISVKNNSLLFKK